jgi:hypothetical protein
LRQDRLGTLRLAVTRSVGHSFLDMKRFMFIKGLFNGVDRGQDTAPVLDGT